MPENSHLSVLVIDPNPGMRAGLQNMLALAGFAKVDFAVNAGAAVRQLGHASYDIILCEYDLGSGTGEDQDGQQLLEDLRHHGIVGPLAIFIMTTSERAYSKVVSAAELAPTDYILKPFTADTLTERIDRALQRRHALLPAHQLIGHGDLREALKVCLQAAADHSPYALDFVRLRAELHVNLNEPAQAEALYRKVLATRPLGWASLGLARTLFAQERIDEAETMLARLVAENPKLMAAYDLLSRCHESNGAPARAQRILEQAVAISPHMLRRLRRLGEVALEAGDVAAAEKSFRQVVARARYSEFRTPEDHVNLVRALVRKPDPAPAGGVIRDLEKSMRGNPDVDACRAISAALLHEAAGDRTATVGELNTAVQAVCGATTLSSGLRIGLARSCLSNQLDKEASEVMLAVMNDAASGVSMQQAMSVFVKAGRPDLADGMGVQLKAQAHGLLAVAAEKTGMGDFKGAAQTLLGALNLSPGSLAVMVAAARGILRQLGEMGWDHPLAERCAGVIDTIRKLDAGHPALGPLSDEFTGAKRKYGIST